MNATELTWTAAKSMVRIQYPKSVLRGHNNRYVGTGGEDSYGPTTVYEVSMHPTDWTVIGLGLTEETAWLEAARGLHLIPDPPEGSYYRRDLIERFGAKPL